MEGGFVLGRNKMMGFRVENGNLTIIPEEAEIVRRIFQMYVYEKKGYCLIAKALNEAGLFTARECEWSDSNVKFVLQNDKYVGDLTQWKKYTADYLTKKTKRNKGEIPFVHIPNHHEAIIDRELWNEAQRQMEERGAFKRKGNKHSNKNWYSNKVFCGKCGHSCNAASNGSLSKRTVLCRNRTRNGKIPRTNLSGKQIGCDNSGTNEDVLAFLMGYVLRHIQNSREEIVEELLSEIQVMQSNDKPIDITPLETEIEKYNHKKLKALDLMLDEQMSKSDLLKQTEIYDSKIVRLTEEINNNRNLVAVHREQIEKVKAHIAEANKTAEVNADNSEIYGELLERFEISKGSAVVYLKCVPFGFKIDYHIKKYNYGQIFNVEVVSFEVVA
jgi:hypothetical protein